MRNVASSNNTFLDSTLTRHGDSTVITVIAHHEQLPAVDFIDYLRVVAWPLVIILLAFLLKDKIREFEGFGIKVKLGIDEAMKEIAAIKQKEQAL